MLRKVVNLASQWFFIARVAAFYKVLDVPDELILILGFVDAILIDTCLETIDDLGERGTASEEEWELEHLNRVSFLGRLGLCLGVHLEVHQIFWRNLRRETLSFGVH